VAISVNNLFLRAEPLDQPLLDVRPITSLTHAKQRPLRSTGRVKPSHADRRPGKQFATQNAAVLPAPGAGHEFSPHLDLFDDLAGEEAGDEAGDCLQRIEDPNVDRIIEYAPSCLSDL